MLFLFLRFLIQLIDLAVVISTGLIGSVLLFILVVSLTTGSLVPKTEFLTLESSSSIGSLLGLCLVVVAAMLATVAVVVLVA